LSELTKLLETVFPSVNIALVNELSLLSDRIGIDNWEVTDAAASKRYEFRRFGSRNPAAAACFPVDPFDLSGRRELDLRPTSFELVGQMNPGVCSSPGNDKVASCSGTVGDIHAFEGPHAVSGCGSPDQNKPHRAGAFITEMGPEHALHSGPRAAAVTAVMPGAARGNARYCHAILGKRDFS